MATRIRAATAAAALLAVSGVAMAQHTKQDERVVVKEIRGDKDGQKYEVVIEVDGDAKAGGERRVFVTTDGKKIDLEKLGERENVFVRRLGGGDGRHEVIIRGAGPGERAERRVFIGGDGQRFELRGEGGEWRDRGDGGREHVIIRRGAGAPDGQIERRVIIERAPGAGASRGLGGDHDVRLFTRGGEGNIELRERLHGMTEPAGKGACCDCCSCCGDEKKAGGVEKLHQHLQKLQGLGDLGGRLELRIEGEGLEGLHKLRGLGDLHEMLGDLDGRFEFEFDDHWFEGEHEEHEHEHEHEIEIEELTDAFGSFPHGAFLRGGPAHDAFAFGVAGQPEAQTESQITIVTSGPDGECKVEIKGDKVRAWLDGERVPDDRVKVTEGSIKILGKDGGVINEFDRTGDAFFAPGFPATPSTPRAFAWRSGDGDNDPIVWSDGPGEAPSAMVWAAQPEDHPPVMIGINMGPLEEGEVDGAVLDILKSRDLGGGDVIAVLGVIDGLPAKKAGVQAGDVIVRVDGEWGINPERLRGVLEEKEPGDTIELLVIRDGERKEIEVKLAAYDAARLAPEARVEAAPDVEFFGQDAWRQNQDVIRLLERLSTQNQHIDAEARERINEAMERLRSNPPRIEFDRLPRLRMDERQPEAPRVFVEPRRLELNREAGEGQQRRLEELESRMERLEARLDRIVELLERRERDR